MPGYIADCPDCRGSEIHPHDPGCPYYIPTPENASNQGDYMLPSTDTPTATTPVAPQITQIFVKVKRELDLGYIPFQKTARFYLKKNQQIPFGMRDASRTSFEISLTAEVNDGDVETVIRDLTEKANAIADRELRVAHPETFKEAEKQEVPEEAFTVSATVVTTTPATDGEDY